MTVAYDHPNVWPMFAWESTIAGLGSFPWQPHEVLLHDKSPLHDDLGHGPQILSPCHLGVGETPRVGDFLNFLTTWISFGSKNRKSLGSLLSILSLRSCTPLPVSCSCWIFGLSAIRAVEFWCQAMSYSRRKLWQCDWPNLEKGRKNCHALQSLGCSGAQESLGCFVCGSSSSGHCGHTAFA